MPVLTVSEKTWPQVGFSRKRSTRPSSSMMVMPNSTGSGTRVRHTVTSAPFSLWNAISAARSKSVSASPEITRKLSSASRSSAFFTQPAVPSGHLLVGVVQLHAEFLTVAEVVAHQRGEELDGDHDLRQAVLAQQPQHVLHDRAVDNRQQRFGHRGGHRTQASAFASGHHDGFHGYRSQGRRRGGSMDRGAAPPPGELGRRRAPIPLPPVPTLTGQGR